MPEKLFMVRYICVLYYYNVIIKDYFFKFIIQVQFIILVSLSCTLSIIRILGTNFFPTRRMRTIYEKYYEFMIIFMNRKTILNFVTNHLLQKNPQLIVLQFFSLQNFRPVYSRFRHTILLQCSSCLFSDKLTYIFLARHR